MLMNRQWGVVLQHIQRAMVPTSLNFLPICTRVVRFCFCFAAFISGMSSSRFLECTQNRLRPMLNGLHSGSVTCAPMAAVAGSGRSKSCIQQLRYISRQPALAT